MASRNNSSGTLNGYDATDVRTPMSALTPLADAADFNATFSWETGRGLPTHVQDLAGTTVNDKPVLEEGANVPGTVTWQLDSGWTLDVGTDGIITWGFLTGHTRSASTTTRALVKATVTRRSRPRSRQPHVSRSTTGTT
ncbi:MAG: hypothetical protein ACJ8FI_06885 [Sphingomicrobium sp.]